jgi:hypothetical protein
VGHLRGLILGHSRSGGHVVVFRGQDFVVLEQASIVSVIIKYKNIAVNKSPRNIRIFFFNTTIF